jgi:hypothetical protein
VEEVGVRAMNFCSHRLQRHRLRSLIEQKLARSGKRGGSAFFGAEAGSSY